MKPSLFESRVPSPSGPMTSSTSSLRAALSGSITGAAIGTQKLMTGGGTGRSLPGVSSQAALPTRTPVILPDQTQPSLLLKMSPLGQSVISHHMGCRPGDML